MANDFEARHAAIVEGRASDPERPVYELRALEEQWAAFFLGLSEGEALIAGVRRRVIEGIAEERVLSAIAHLEEALSQQWTLGTWSSGAGEGLASIAEVRRLQVALAWLHGARTDPEGPAHALSLIAQVLEDPNGQGGRYAAMLKELEQKLDGDSDDAA